MSGFPTLPPRSGRLSAPTWQYHRSSSGSPVRQRHFQQHVDDLISSISPATAVQALRYPSGELKNCLDTASTSEQNFAMRAALAASNIQEWLDELSRWPWPTLGGSAGFEEPTSNRRILKALTTRTKSLLSAPSESDPVTPEKQMTPAVHQSSSQGNEKTSSPSNGTWVGSLPAADVTRYDSRVDEIQREIGNLEVEDMKQHVLHHHILPLTPPGTPSYDGTQRRASTSMANFVKMDDLTAVVTAIVLQTLPLLSRLLQLLNTWHIRILVLKKIPNFLKSLCAAEAAILDAWHALRLGDRIVGTDGQSLDAKSPPKQDLSRDDFCATKATLERKVSRAAQLADYMLDILDGCEDTIPDDWIDRIDAAERDYGEWVTVCERKLRESEWRKAWSQRPKLPPPQETPAAVAVPSFMPATPEEDASESSPGKSGSQASSDRQRVLALPDIQVPITAAAMGFHTPPNLTPQSSTESLRLEPSLPIIRRASSESAINNTSPASSSSSDDLLPSHPYRDIPVLGLPADFQVPPSDGQDLSSSPPDFHGTIRPAVGFSDMPTVNEMPGEDGAGLPQSPTDLSFMTNDDDEDLSQYMETASTRRMSFGSDDDQLQHQIYEILESIPAKIRLSSQPAAANHLNPPDFKMPRKPKTTSDGGRSTSAMSSRSGTPSFLLAPAYTRSARPRQQRGNKEIKLYHLSRSTGEAPIKLFIRLVGENGERVMVRVGGGWADLSEYLKEYASHHNRRSKVGGGEKKVEIRDLPIAPPGSSGSPYTTSRAPSRAASRAASRAGSSPPSRPASALGSPMSMSPAPLTVAKTRKAAVENSDKNTRSPMATAATPATKVSDTPSSVASTTRSRSSSWVSWVEEDSSLGMSGPRAKNIEMSEESKAWVESVKEKVRIASGELKVAEQADGKFGEMGKAGGTKRIFRKA